MIFNKIKDEKRVVKFNHPQRIQHPMPKNVKLLLERPYPRNGFVVAETSILNMRML